MLKCKLKRMNPHSFYILSRKFLNKFSIRSRKSKLKFRLQTRLGLSRLKKGQRLLMDNIPSIWIMSRIYLQKQQKCLTSTWLPTKGVELVVYFIKKVVTSYKIMGTLISSKGEIKQTKSTWLDSVLNMKRLSHHQPLICLQVVNSEESHKANRARVSLRRERISPQTMQLNLVEECFSRSSSMT